MKPQMRRNRSRAKTSIILINPKIQGSVEDRVSSSLVGTVMLVMLVPSKRGGVSAISSAHFDVKSCSHATGQGSRLEYASGWRRRAF